jgi:hypothetical protein
MKLTKSEIEANIEVIMVTIVKFNGLEITAIMDYLGEITSLQSLATETQASAKYRLLEATNAELDRQAKLKSSEGIAPSIKKLRADSMVREYHYLYEKAQRLANNVSHTIDACRTKISYLKQELHNAQYQNG